MARLTILSGPAGVGKSTYLNNYEGRVISSDDIRQELFGRLTNEHDQEVWKVLHERVIESLSNGEDVALGATFLTRKRRLATLENIKQKVKDFDTHVVVLHKPLETILEQNAGREGDKRVPAHIVKSMYKSMEPPKVGLDCDTFEVIAPPISDYRDEMNKGIHEPHNSVYHLETIAEHVQMTIDEAQNFGPEYVVLAKWHDTGKAVCREPKDSQGLGTRFVREKFGSHDRFIGHEKVSSMYYTVAGGRNADMTDAILYHMQAHEGISNKTANRFNISDRALDMLHTFAHKVDSEARVRVDEDVAYFEKLNKVSGLLKQAQDSNDIRISPNFERDLFTLKYASAGVDFSDQLNRNARGLTVTSDNKIVTIGFEKFFNYKQLDHYDSYDDTFKQERADISGETLTVYEKLDGTFLTVGAHEGDFIAATSSSTRLDFSRDIEAHLHGHPRSQELHQFMEDENLCLFFEYTAPSNQIIVRYEEPEYTLIGARVRNLDAPLVSRERLEEIASKFEFPISQKMEMSKDDILDYMATNQTTEGFVAQNEHGHLVKFKTDWWFREKERSGELFFGQWDTKSKFETYANLYVNDEFDDIIAKRNQQRPGTMKHLDLIQEYADEKVVRIDQLHQATKHLEPRDIAQGYKEDGSLLFALRKSESESIRDVIVANDRLRVQFFADIFERVQTELEQEAIINEVIAEDQFSDLSFDDLFSNDTGLQL